MNTHLNEDDRTLDRLLARPPQMADRGFSSRVRTQLKRTEKLKIAIFSGMGSLWLLLLGLFTTPEQLVAQFTLATSFLARQLPGSDDLAMFEQFTINSLVDSSIIFLLTVAAVVLVSGLINQLRH